jgi:hypothetical protein
MVFFRITLPFMSIQLVFVGNPRCRDCCFEGARRISAKPPSTRELPGESLSQMSYQPLCKAPLYYGLFS